MRFTVEPKPFLEAITTASLPVKPRNPIPILACLRIEARDNTVIISGTDMDTEVKVRCEAAVSEVGGSCVNARTLKELVSHMTQTIDVAAGLSLDSGVHSHRITDLPIEDFPTKEKPDPGVEIEGGVQAFLRCAPFAGDEEVRYYLKGVCFDAERAFATNGHVARHTACTGGARQIVPAEYAPIFQKIGGRLFLSDATWRLENEHVHVLGKLIDAVYPDLTPLFSGGDARLTIDADGLLAAVKAASAGSAKSIRLVPHDDMYAVQGDRFEGPHMETSVDVQAHGDLFQCLLSREYLTTALTAFAGEVLNVAGDSERVSFRGADGQCEVMAQRDAAAAKAEAA